RAHVEEALEMEPRDFWANFHLGTCAYRLERFEGAALAFHGCVLLSTQAPETAHCHFNLALAQAALGHTDDARRHYTLALRLNPALADAALNRGLLHLAGGDLPAALSDLTNALAQGSDPALTHFHIAQVYLARRDNAAAR